MFPFYQDGKLVTKEYISSLCSPKDLESSYARCRIAGVPVELAKPKAMLPEIQIIPLLIANTKLLTVADQLITPITYSETQKEYFFILCEQELVALKTYASQRETARKVEIGSGTVFTEESCGTNALSLAREHNRIVAIRGKQHYSDIFKNLWCVAGLVKNTEGRIVGYLNISIPAENELGFAVELLKILLVAIEKGILLLNLGLAGIQITPLSPLPLEVARELTPREKDIYWLLLQRLKSKEIATTLNLSISTVNTHRKNIYQKLCVNGLSGLLSKLGR